MSGEEIPLTPKEKITKFIQETYPNGHPMFYTIIIDLMDLHNRKNKDYATADKPLGNFERVGSLCDMYGIWEWDVPSSLKVSIIYQLKQFDAGMKLLGSAEEAVVEGIPERFRDNAVYSIIDEILYLEGKAEVIK